MSRADKLLVLCLSFIVGIFLGLFVSLSLLMALLILSLFLISVFWKRRMIVFAGFCLLALMGGIWRYQAADVSFKNNVLGKYLDSQVVVYGFIDQEPEAGLSSQKISLKVEKINEETVGSLGKILVSSRKYPRYQYGDRIIIKGLLEKPSEDIDGFNYRNFLKKEGVYGVMGFPEIELIGKDSGNFLIKTLVSFKDKFQENAARFISPPQRGLLEALVFGEESNISKDLKEKFNLTGTRHIAAVSGMNITIIASLILAFALSLELWRQHAFYLSLILLLVYILMIGAPASAVRAGIMAFLLLLAQHLGRASSVGNAIVLSAVFMLLVNPFLLTLDIGFQLSFLAILGLVYLQPLISLAFRKIPDFKFFPLKSVLGATLAAQVFTLPVLIYNFGYVSLVSPLANILIVPLLAPLTILISFFGLAAVFFAPLAYLLSWIAWFCLSYIIWVIEWFSRVPFASFSFKIPLILFLSFYILLGTVVWRLNRKYNQPAFLR